MAKSHSKQKQAVIEIPEMYKGLPTEQRIIHMLTKQCIVKDKQGRMFRFIAPSNNHIVSGGIEHIWKDFDQFHDDFGAKNVLDMHQNLFNAPVPVGQSFTDNALKTWLKMAQQAEDRTGANAVPKDPTTGRKSTIGTRKYMRVMVTDPDGKVTGAKPTTLNTPQAKTCLAIFDGVAVPDKDGIPVVSESDLKTAVYARKEELKTRQDAWRIFQYYRPQLLKDGVIRHD